MHQPHRTTPLENIHGRCENCRDQVGDQAVRCAVCLSATYCSYSCRVVDHPHQSLCRSLQSSAVPRDKTPLAAHLLAAGRDYVDVHYNSIKCVAACRTLSMLDSSIVQTPERQLSHETSRSFIARFRFITDTYLWLVILQEKGTASRTGEPRAQDLFHPDPCYVLQLVQANYPQGRCAMKEALRQKAALDQHSAGIIVAFLIRDRDGRDTGDFVICMDVPDIHKLQFSYFNNPDEATAS